MKVTPPSGKKLEYSLKTFAQLGSLGREKAPHFLSTIEKDGASRSNFKNSQRRRGRKKKGAKWAPAVSIGIRSSSYVGTCDKKESEEPRGDGFRWRKEEGRGGFLEIPSEGGRRRKKKGTEIYLRIFLSVERIQAGGKEGKKDREGRSPKKKNNLCSFFRGRIGGTGIHLEKEGKGGGGRLLRRLSRALLEDLNQKGGGLRRLRRKAKKRKKKNSRGVATLWTRERIIPIIDSRKDNHCLS